MSEASSNPSIAVLGLGIMGKALTKLYHEKGYDVHCWNRGAAKRNEVAALQLDRVQLYEDLSQAIAAVNTVIIMIGGDKDLVGVQALVQSIPAACWNNKMVINFASHEPFAAKIMQNVLDGVGAQHVSGALICVPSNIGTPAAVVLVSTLLSVDAYEQHEAKVALDFLGRVEKFDGDIGYGPLVDIGLIWGCFLGYHGFELAVLACQRYGASDAILDRLLVLCKELLPMYIDPFFSLASTTIRTQAWESSGLNTSLSQAKMYLMHQDFLEKLDIVDDTIVGAIARYAEKDSLTHPNVNDNHKVTKYIKGTSL